MHYVDGFVAAVPTANKAEYIRHSKEMAAIFREFGVIRTVDCWGDDVPEGEITSFPMAVQCKEDETVCFSWILWPSREVRNQGMQALMADERMDPEKVSMPFDGMRLIYGGFEMIVDE